MKQLFLKTLLLIPGILLLSGCYTKLAEPVTREEYYLEQDTTQYTEQDESYENYTFDSPSLSEYNQGYRDAYREFLNSNLWFGYNPSSSFYNYNSYWHSPWSSYHSYYLGYYDPFFYDPFYDWGYYSYGYYNPYRYRNFGYYHSQGYYYHGGGYYYGGYTGSQTIAEGRYQKKADWQLKDNTPTNRRATRIPKKATSGFQTSLNLPMNAGNSLSATKGSQTSIDSKSQRSDRKNNTFKIKQPNNPPIPGFQSTIEQPSKPKTKSVRQVPKTIMTNHKSHRTNKSSSVRIKSKPATKSSSSRKETISKPKRKSSSGKSSSSSGSSPSYRSPSKNSSGRSSSVRSSSSSRSSGRSSSVRSSSGGKSSGSSSSRSSSSSTSSSKSSKSSSKRSK